MQARVLNDPAGAVVERAPSDTEKLLMLAFKARAPRPAPRAPRPGFEKGLEVSTRAPRAHAAAAPGGGQVVPDRHLGDLVYVRCYSGERPRAPSLFFS